MPELVARTLVDNFRIRALADVGIILANFVSLKNALSGSPVFECVELSACPRLETGELAHAYVLGSFGWVRRWRDRIYVCPTWFGEPNFQLRVVTLIHERAHQSPLTGDQAYRNEPRWSRLTVDTAIDNADSYAWAAKNIALRIGAYRGRPSLKNVLPP